MNQLYLGLGTPMNFGKSTFVLENDDYCTHCNRLQQVVHRVATLESMLLSDEEFDA
jgi:hypothetical protein